MNDVLRVFSAGWGVQSVAVLAAQAQKPLPEPYDEFVFANVGDDSESPDTLAYYREHVVPFAAQHGIKIVERQKTRHNKPETLLEAVLRDNRSIPIPVVFRGQGCGNRTCTFEFKIDVVRRYIAHELKAKRAVLGIGFSTDEAYRVHKKYPDWHHHFMQRGKDNTWKQGKRIGFWQLYEYPLIQLRLSRHQCAKIISDASLPVPPPSSCWFCPFHLRGRLIEEKRHAPERFAARIRLQDELNAKYQRIRSEHPKASAFIALHPDGIDLREVPDQMSLWDQFQDVDGECQVGVCGL